MGRGPASVLVIACMAVVWLTSCNGDQQTDPGSTTITTSPAQVTSTSTPNTTSEPVATSTTTATSTATTTPTTTGTSTPTTTTTTTTSTTTVPVDCDTDRATEILDATITQARLAPGGPWQAGAETTRFDERTNPAAEFGDRLAFTCAERFVQRTPADAERLALIAWNDVRHAAVVQASDAPGERYRTDVLFQLFFEQPKGEWLDQGFVWAAGLSNGESIVIATRDYNTGITAKSWQSFVPRFEDLPVTLESEQFGIDALIDVGARNISVAEPAPFGYPIGTIQFNTPLALIAFAVIGPTGSFDPMVALVEGDSTYRTVEGVVIRETDAIELGSPLYETGWSCTDHEWRLYSGLGSPAELADFAETLVRSLRC